MSSSTTSSSAASGRARSCTGCRQVKLACDARKTAPQPCSRCKSKGLQCRFDSKFKRIPMRRVAQEISNEIHKLVPATTHATHAVSPRQSYDASDPYNSPSISIVPQTEDSAHGPSFQIPVKSYGRAQQWLQVVDGDYYISYRLGDVDLDAETTVVLLKHFARHYLPHVPFLVPMHSLYAVSMRSPLLFWTIILVAAREHAKTDGLYEQISVAHGILVSQIHQNAIQNIEEIHALLLLCMWPVPRNRERDDPAWNYIGTAINAAMSLNCHKPLFADSAAGSWKGMALQPAADIGAETLAVTWIYCFHMGVRLAAAQGYPPPLSTSSQLQSVSKAISAVSLTITEEEKARTEILRLSCLSTIEIDAVDDSSVRFSLIQMFDAQLNALQQSYANCWTRELDVDTLASKLYLYGLLLVIPVNDTADTQQRMLDRQVILIRAQDAAQKLIFRMTQLSNIPVEEGLYPAGALSFYPKHYFTSLHMAAVFLFRFLASYQGVSQQSTAVAVNGLTEAHKVLQSFPEHRDAVKAAIHLQYLVDIIRDTEAVQPFPLNELVITHRLGASVAHDASFRSTNRRHRDPITGANTLMSNWIMMAEDPRHRLPLTPEQKATKSSRGSSSNHGTDDGQNQGRSQSGPWNVWDQYMEDFEVMEHWNADLLAQMNPGVPDQHFDEAAITYTVPVMDHHQQYLTH